MKQTIRRIGLEILGLLLVIFPALGAALPNRTWAVATITTIPTLRWSNISNTWGGSNVTDNGPNFGLLIQQSIFTYSDAMGQIVFVIFFAIPFIMMWIVQADMVMPAIIGMFFSLYIFAKLPEQYILFSGGCFVICVASLIWSLYRRGY
jgi:hypothetical protein